MPDKNEEALKTRITALAQQRFGGDFERMFEHYSRHRQSDERINRDELSELAKDADLGNWATRGAWIDAILARFDTDRDNAISWAEFDRFVNAYSTR